ncbi:MAG: hypothetical protein ACRDJM_04815 [Actinomycetota bacterium]
MRIGFRTWDCEALRLDGADRAPARTRQPPLWSLRRSHSGIDAIDYLIAGTAEITSAQLLTLNVKHFPMLSGLRPAF